MNFIKPAAMQTSNPTLNKILSTQLNEQNPGIYYGSQGFEFLNYYASIYTNSGIEEAAINFLESVENRIHENNFLGPGLSTGIAGLIESINIVNEKANLFDETDYLSDIYDELLNACILLIQQHNFDFYTGSIGIMNLFVRASKRHPAFIKPFLIKICQTIEEENIIPIHFINSHESDRDEMNKLILVERAHYSNGIAHGLPAILLVLSKVHNIIQHQYILQLIEQIIELSILYKNPRINNGESIYLERIYLPESNKENKYYGRLAWCYSDLTLGWAFYKSGQLLNDKRVSDLGIEALEHTIVQDNTLNLCEHTNIICLCHGSAGNAYIFKRIYEETQNPIFIDAFERWKKRAERHYLNNEIYFDVDTRQYLDNFSMMDGIIGYGLFLMSIEQPECNSWNSLLLLD